MLYQLLLGCFFCIAQAQTSCPKGFDQTSSVVWPCGPTSSSVTVSMQANKVIKAFTIPQGVMGLTLTAQANVSIDLYLYDAAADVWVLKFNDGLVHDTKRRATQPLIVTFTGKTGSALQAQVHNYAPSRALSLLTYSYDGLPPSLCVPRKAPIIHIAAVLSRCYVCTVAIPHLLESLHHYSYNI
eukprot:gnl/TRDRNA2_/TRDRNA2_172820_c2_seq1.p1 gnl/TRDRNA2_/TRDRNA2_172820_c2~~gnl/TRDRNA2_/TRDRNA2_172820_c2_seq1.p1  ORF type:complete len:184 (-),score=17.38 gnl/TRDRNA2_/TRDRNA2_172820_c2_seq1:75-626(-)